VALIEWENRKNANILFVFVELVTGTFVADYVAKNAVLHTKTKRD